MFELLSSYILIYLLKSVYPSMSHVLTKPFLYMKGIHGLMQVKSICTIILFMQSSSSTLLSPKREMQMHPW
jgi:hypothetical protein